MSATAGTQEPTPAKSGLLRVVGRWDMVALVINGIVGAGIFGLPQKVHALLGAWGLLAIVACAILMGFIIACFAEVSSRFSETGGPYLYAAEAFGPFTAFVVGWLLWLARVTGLCAIAGVLAEYLSFLVPAVGMGVPRALLLSTVICSLATLHIRGTRGATRFGTIITIAKLAPLLLFVTLGLPHISAEAFDFAVQPGRKDFSSAVLLLGFAFVGWETALVAAGEMREPRKDAPFALGIGLAGVAALYVGIQAVCVGVLPALAQSTRPVADAANTFLGPAGATLIVVGAAISMLGTINGGVLAISRIPYAMAEAKQLPRALAGLHPVYRTPVLSIVLSCAVVLLLTLTRGHIYLLTISTISRLFAFTVTIVSIPIFRRRAAMAPALFTLPGGMTIPVVALGLIVWLLSGTSWTDTRDVLIATVAGAAVFGVMTLAGARRREN
ncbi:MAG: amino acid permease [Gemmatimonadaceae bacterium]|nr:amino acid permease [Gemmatimonadaceae bacterium]